MKKFLCLFSGTRSFEKVFEKDKKWECRGVDIDNHFTPYYNVDILKWDYKTELKDWIPDYIHSSFVCCEFTNIKNYSTGQRNLELGFGLLNKSLEIIEWVKHINPQLKFTLENPRNKFVLEHTNLNKYKKVLTSYCKYGYLYKKPTYFWYGGFNLNLEPICRDTRDKTNWCKSKLENKKLPIHQVRIGFNNSGDRIFTDEQITTAKYLRNLKKQGLYKDYTIPYFNYRIPEALVKDIYNCVNF